MRTVAIIQARMGSTRLPGKVLAEIGGATMLARVVRRARRARLVSEVVVATTEGAADDAIVAECARLGAPSTRGSEEDVLDRYFRAATAHGAEAVVRITSDCPLIDPVVIDRVTGAFLAARADYASNVHVRSYPRGLDVEAMTADALARAHREAREPHQRVHVTPFIYENPALFRLLPIEPEDGVDRSAERWTVDAPEDLALVRALYARLGNRDDFGWREALAALEREPDLRALNRHVRQKALREG